MIAKSVISQYRLSRGLLLFAVWCIFFAANGAGQLVPAIETPATTNKDTAVDLALLAVATIKQVAFADSDPMTTQFSDDGVSFRGSFPRHSSRRYYYLVKMIESSVCQAGQNPSDMMSKLRLITKTSLSGRRCP